MKKLLVFIGAIFICTFAFANTIEWYVDGSVYQTTTCASGDDITPPTAPEKYGYSFVEWSEYVLLEYIESTGTQYIKTEVTGLAEWHITAQANPSTVRGNQILIGCSSRQGQWFGPVKNTEFWGGDNNPSGGVSYATKADMQISFATRELSWNVNGVQDIVSNMSSVFATSYNLFQYNGFWFTGKVWNASCYQNNTLVRNFIPAKRTADGAIGMYDTVTDTFFTNAGTGNFIAGPEVGGL